ncbi:MAG: M48 family metalloprotease [Alphaproteobacteria bacterium]
MRSFIIFLLTAFSLSVSHSSELNIMRDAETENLFKEISRQLIKDNNLNLGEINFFIDNKEYVNAFVIPGQKIFITKGLIIESKGLEDIAGVIAHEIGHIVGGHFSNKMKAMEKSSMINIISSILAAGAIAAGAGQAGTAILLGGQKLGSASFLSFSRTQESLADQNAIRLLKKSGFSLQGILNVFKVLEKNESLKKINPYLLTHPLSSERKKYVEFNLKDQKLKNFKNLENKFLLVKAKVHGFFLNDRDLQFLYPKKESIQSLYAYSLRYYKIGKIKDALLSIQKCINLDKKNPYFYELKGQILFENGMINKSIVAFRKAKELKPDEKSFNLFLAKSLYHSKQKELRQESIKLLWSYIKDDDFPYDAWHYLGLNYGKLKKHDYSSYALAEKYLLVNELNNAKIHIQRAKRISNDPVLINKISDLEKEIIKRESK